MRSPSLCSTSEFPGEIKQEIARLEKELLDAQTRKRLEASRENFKKVDALLIVIDRHSRTTCNDHEPINFGRCAQYTLLWFKHMGQ